MINLLDDHDNSVFGLLYHISVEGAITCVKYGPGQLKLAKEYIPQGERHYVHHKFTNIWRVVTEPGNVRVIDHCEIPKEIKLYLFLLGD